MNPSAVFEFIPELALGGGRVAWIEGGGGNEEDLSLYEAPVSGGPSKQLDFATNSSGAEGEIGGDYVGQLYGAGPLLFCTPCPGGGLPQPGSARLRTHRLASSAKNERQASSSR